MLVFVEVQVALGFLVFRAKHAIGRGELGHDQPASAEVANEASKDGIGNASHGSQNGRGSDLNIADRNAIRHGGASRGEDACVHIRRIFPILTHLAYFTAFPKFTDCGTIRQLVEVTHG